MRKSVEQTAATLSFKTTASAHRKCVFTANVITTQSLENVTSSHTHRCHCESSWGMSNIHISIIYVFFKVHSLFSSFLSLFSEEYIYICGKGDYLFLTSLFFPSFPIILLSPPLHSPPKDAGHWGDEFVIANGFPWLMVHLIGVTWPCPAWVGFVVFV